MPQARQEKNRPFMCPSRANNVNSLAALAENLTISWDVLGIAPYAERAMTSQISKT